MIQKSSLPVKTFEKIDNTGEQNLISMDSQLSYYLWQITQLNFVKQTACDSFNTGLNLTAMNHYKKRWRDKYITPHYNQQHFQGLDPLRMMNNMVNDSRTYIHVWSYQRLLSLIIEDDTPINAQNMIEKYANTNYLKQFLFAAK